MGTVLSLLILAALVLLAGALFAWRRGLRKQAALIVALAAVMAINVGIWTLPDSSGSAPLDRELQ
jgi:hypothetical protein